MQTPSTLLDATAATVAEAVAAQIRRTPAAPAVAEAGRTLSYAELDAAATAVARHLRRHGVQPGQAVAVCLPRGRALVCAMLGILRLGAIVVPLDKQSPPERQRHMLADSASVALIHGGAAVAMDGVLPLDVNALLVPPAAADRPLDPPPAPAYSFLFYTSGTTGRPKGVEVRDAGILRLARPGYIDLQPADRYACLSNPAFDALSFEVWVPLMTGGCCVILADEEVQDPARLAARLAEERIDTLFMTVALFNAIVERAPACFDGLRQVLIGGEQLNAPLIRRWLQREPAGAARLHNVYGPTETTTFALCHPVPPDFDAAVVPIGQPLAATSAILVVDGTRLAAQDEVAELYLGGEGLAVGYRNLPDETARQFVRLGWLDGGHGRYYRSGDLVRRNAAGAIEYVGRADRQVKVRGFRIEPGELERRILDHPAVRQAYVCTRRDESLGSHELLAYLVLQADLSFEDFDRHLAASLPAYMRPHWVYLVEALPLNANGKVDQAALLARRDLHWRRADSRALAASAWQREVLALAGQVLGIGGLRLGDSWIGNGGDSLKALRLRFEVRRRWGCELPQAAILQQTFEQLAATIEAGRSMAASPYPALAAPGGATSAPATSEQQRLWLLQQQAPQSCAYNVALAFALEGEVDPAALRQALCRLVADHPALRTGFVAGADGLRQEVAEPYDPCCFEPARAFDDEAGWRAFARHVGATPFDLAVPRMLQAWWLALPAGRAVLLLHLHHIALDGWSLNVLLGELSAHYAAARAGQPLPPHEPVPTPLDYAGWQAAWAAEPAYRAQREALRAFYAEQPEIAAPLQPLRPPARGDAQLLHASLDVVRRAALDRLGAELGLTRFQLLLAVFAWSLYGVTGRAQPRIASPVANRPLQAFDASVGMFANTVLLPLQLAPRDDLRSLLLRHGATAQTVLAGQDVALADVLADQGEAFRGEGALFDFLFVLENTDFAALDLGCRSRVQWLAPAEAKCPLALSVIESEAGLDCVWEYAGSHFETAEVEAMAALFRQGLDALTEGRAMTLAELAAPYRRSLAEPGRGLPAPLAFDTVADWFGHQARLTPDAPALAWGERRLGYAELDAHAAALAAELLARLGPAPDDATPRHVALYFEPSPEHVAALLALARLDLTIVPLDPSYPPALLRQILDQVEPACILLPPGGSAALDALDGGRFARHAVALAERPAAVPALPPRTRQRPLYTLFTSGSTGRPKGVQVPDRTLCNLLQWQREDGGLAARAATQQFSMLSFDVSFQEIFGTLCGGGCLHLLPPGGRHDLPALLDHLDAVGIERIFMPYVALQLLAEQGASLGRYPSKLREVVTAGEQLLCTDAIRRWFGGLAGARLFNHYGPTETHVVSSLCLAGDPARWPARPAIGRPIANAWLRVVDEADQPLPPGCPGHLLAGGPMAAPCYLDDAALNAARFTTLADGAVFYRTGDRACFDRDGLLHYLGRDDQQVKFSGHRLELGQVEAALLLHPAVVNAVVAKDGEQLVACLQCRDGAAVTAEALQAHLAPLLPAYVRIARFRRLAQMPRTASGKLDRRAVLQAPGEELHAQAAGAAPAMTALEAQLAALFEAAVGKPVAPEQSFFDAGAGSLGLMRFHLRCTAELALPLAIADLFEHVSIRRLARFLTERPAAAEAVRTDASAVIERPAEPDPVEPISADEPIAIIGMAVNLPGAADLAAFWDMVLAGGRGIVHFDAADGMVGARSQMAGMLAFDPEHFGISRQEARLMDPQQRQLLMSCVQALAHAGIADAGDRRIGLVASCGENTYFQAMLREADPARLPDGFQLALHHDKDFLATKAAYHLDLRGPALTVQAACASSLIAVHVAAGMLRQGDSEVMLAAGVLVDPYLAGGYRYRPQHIFSRDGHCRPFSDDASGTIGGSGAGVVVLKPLRLARRDGDTVYALVAGSALNNDGAGKLSYTAPSLAGQREAIRAALRRGGLAGADVGYVEAHGTGTQLGDPVEVGALRQAYLGDAAPNDVAGEAHCALASVKSQIGHLGAAAGVVGLVRAALAVHHGRIPPNVDFGRLNPRIGSDIAPFYIPTAAQPWPAGRRRVAAVSSFGIGGTNAHLLLAQAEAAAAPAAAALPCLLLSASSEAALRLDAGRIADFLAAQPAAYGQVLRHLQAGRAPRRWRVAAVCRDAAAAVAWLRGVQAGAAESADSAGPAGAAARAGSIAPAQVAGPLDAPALDAGAVAPDTLIAAWLAGRALAWPAGPAQAPWDFPPPAFALADYDFERAAPAAAGAAQAVANAAAAGTTATVAETADPAWPARQPAGDWLYQPQWVRLRRAPQRSAASSPRLRVALLAQPLVPALLQALAAGGRLVQVIAGPGFARLADDRFTVDPADADSLRRLWAALDVGEQGVDWLHALPLAIDGAVGEAALARAQWACVDTAAALLQAVAATPAARALRIWWLSSQAQPVDGPVLRPEPGLLAGASVLAQQECAIASHWLDLPGGDWAGWLPALPALLAEADAAALPQRLALRHGYLWQAAQLPVAAPPAMAEPAVDAAGAHLVLGGTGGIGASIAAELLANGAERVILLARRAGLPEALAGRADRITLLELDLAATPLDEALARIAAITDRLDGVVHAAGSAAGGLIARRDAAAMGQGVRGKLRGALLVEGLIARYRPAWAVWCSSMAALFGGVGQLDYAAANGLLDGFAQHRGGPAETTRRIGIDWDIWREVGMARQALQSDRQHQAHLAVGLSVEEGRRVFAQALQLQLPQLLVSTTAIEQAPAFYAPQARAEAPPAAAAAAPADSAERQLAHCLCRWLGLERLDADASLYDLGADSLTLLDLIGEVQQRFGVEIALSQLSHKVSLAEVLALLEPAASVADDAAGIPAAGAPPVSLEIWQQGSGSDLLCLVHPVGGDIQAYRALVARLDPRWTVCLIADPALRQAGLPAWPLEERARLYHAALRQRFAPAEWQWHLAGWSFGAWVALAMAAEAEAAGTAAAALYLLDPPPPGSGPRFQDYTAAEVEAVFAHELGQRAGEDGGAEAARYREGLTRCCLANLASMARYALPRLAHTASHVWIAREPVAGLPAPLGSPEAQRQRWQKQLAQLASWHGVDTTHYGLVRPPHAAAVAGFINTASVPVQMVC